MPVHWILPVLAIFRMIKIPFSVSSEGSTSSFSSEMAPESAVLTTQQPITYSSTSRRFTDKSSAPTSGASKEPVPTLCATDLCSACARIGKEQVSYSNHVHTEHLKSTYLTLRTFFVRFSKIWSCYKADASYTVGIRLPHRSGIQMVKMCQIPKWYANWMVTWIADHKSGNWIAIRYLWTTNRHLC